MSQEGLTGRSLVLHLRDDQVPFERPRGRFGAAAARPCVFGFVGSGRAVAATPVVGGASCARSLGLGASQVHRPDKIEQKKLMKVMVLPIVSLLPRSGHRRPTFTRASRLVSYTTSEAWRSATSTLSDAPAGTCSTVAL